MYIICVCKLWVYKHRVQTLQNETPSFVPGPIPSFSMLHAETLKSCRWAHPRDEDMKCSSLVTWSVNFTSISQFLYLKASFSVILFFPVSYMYVCVHYTSCAVFVCTCTCSCLPQALRSLWVQVVYCSLYLFGETLCQHKYTHTHTHIHTLSNSTYM